MMQNPKFCPKIEIEVNKWSIRGLSKAYQRSIGGLSEVYRRSIGSLSEVYQRSVRGFFGLQDILQMDI